MYNTHNINDNYEISIPYEAIKLEHCLPQTCINQIGTFPSATISGMKLGESHRVNDLDPLIAAIADRSRLNES